MEQTELKIEGMSCGHCVMALKKELGKIESIKIVNVEIGRAVIETDKMERVRPEIEKAVSEAGFSLVR
jgi:copper chaperone